jgi:rhodanese-related sulfurtransferase
VATRKAGNSSSQIDQISLSELVGRLKDPSLTIVDVLPATAYQQGHIPGALNLPVAEVAERAPAVLPDTHAEIAVYCGGFT